MTNTIQELQLIKRTAWVNANREPKGCTEVEAQKMTPFVVNAVVYTAVLDGVLYDLLDALKAERTMNDSAKKVLRMLHKQVAYVHGEIYRAFNGAIEGFGKFYYERYDRVSEAIEKRVGMEGGQRYYNIVLALLRLIEKNNHACGRYRSPALVAIEPNYRRLKELRLPYEDKGSVMELIIEGATKEVIGYKKFKEILNE